MTDYERHMPPLHEHDKDKGAMVRTVLQGLILAGILWLATSINQQNTAITRLQVQIEGVQASLADVPAITRQLAQAQIQIAEHERRIGRIEDHETNPAVKGWTR